MAYVSPDRRISCGGTNKSKYLGGCFQHLTVPDTASIWKNVTLFSCYNPTGSISCSFYTRPEYSALPGCAALPDCNPPNPPCGPWATGSTATTASYDDMVGTTHYENYFQRLTESIDLSACRKIGFKTVQAQKYWQGRFGFLSSDPGGMLDTSSLCPCNYEPLRATPDDTKYLSWRIKIDSGYQGAHTAGCPIGVYNSTYTFDQTNRVGRYDGLITSTYSKTVSDPDSMGIETYFDDLKNFNVSNGVLTSNTTTFTQYFADSYVRNDVSGSYGYEEITKTITDTYCLFYYKNWFYGECELSGEIYRTDYYYYFKVELFLDEPYTSEQVYEDAKTLSAQWDLGDDDVYPWRTDNYPTVAPVVTYYEQHGATVDAPYSESYVDPNTGIITGEILGAPMPVGYDGFFDLRHKNYKTCLDGLAYVWYIDSYGAKSGYNLVDDVTDAYVPKTATQWTNQFDACDTYPPAAGCAYFKSGVLYLQKYAETLISRPSMNFARPCGADRFAPDYTTSSCFTAADKVLTTWGATTTFDASRYALVCGDETLNGIWNFTIDSTYQLTLTDQVASSSWLPSELFDDESCGDGRVSMVRWNLTPPAICGRNYVVSTSSTSPVTCSLEKSHYLIDDDYVRIDGATTVQVKWQSATSVALVGITPGTPMEYLTSPFSADWQWDDSTPKHDYTTITYTYDYRETGEIDRLQAQYIWCGDCGENPASVRQDQTAYGIDESITSITCNGACLKWNSCYPQTVCVSPNTEGFPSGSSNVIAFPETFVCDERYGSRWMTVIKQWMADPYWQTPPRECSEGGPIAGDWVEDTGDCTGQYPIRPYVEARCGTPDGAPQPVLPWGVKTDFSQWTNEVAYDPIEILGRASDGDPTPAAYNGPVNIYLNQLSCVCSEGTFGGVYETRDGVACTDDLPI